METMKQWRNYPEGRDHKVVLQCDHKKLEYCQRWKMVSRRQARWPEILSSYHFVIEHLEGMKNPVDGPSRRPDYQISHENMTAKLLANIAATTFTESHDDHQPEIKAAQETDFLATEILPTLVDDSTADKCQWRSFNGALTCERRIMVPTAFRCRVTSHFHDNHEFRHFEARTTA